MLRCLLFTLDTILDLLRRQGALEFQPGDEHAYSSSGYNLLAAIIAKATGQSFRAWTDANLFRPLQMDHTHVCEDPAEVVPNRADSYAPEARNFRRMVSQLSAPGAGSVLTSTEDMGKWLINFETAKVGGKKALAMMQRSGKLNNGADVEYGFGIRVSKWSRYRGAIARCRVAPTAAKVPRWVPLGSPNPGCLRSIKCSL
jgi:CubicO group peptidase (beta-lactamase class C family)